MKSLFPLLALFFLQTALNAQYFEVGVLGGGGNYQGDLSNNSSTVYLGQTHFAGGVFGRYNANDFLSVRLGFNYTTLSGADANAPVGVFRDRNLHFQTDIYEAALIGEFNILRYQPYNLANPFSPYLFGGIAFFTFNPKAEYQGDLVALQPLGTEGQGMPDRPDPYQTQQFAIPFGFGLKYALNDHWNLGIELGFRKTFTDYIDDVSSTYVSYNDLLASNGELAAALANRQGELLGSDPVIVPTGTQRGDGKTTDTYFILGLTVSYNFIDNGLVGSRGRSGRRRSGCRTD
ncbi:MAG: outer membrane beta-barrel protein [Saprospiraceae bacterium]|nr:outer membrane beta-barrel protein [Saprospiraceae bacterium]